MIKILKLDNIGEGVEEIFAAEIRVKTGDKIKKGDVIAEFETYKTVFAYESEYDGIVKEIYIELDNMHKLPLDICSVEISGDTEIKINPEIKIETEEKKLNISPKAKKLIKENNINLDDLKNKLKPNIIINEKVVNDYIRENVTNNSGYLNQKFYNYLLENFDKDRSFFKLPENEKIQKYRDAGAIIGANVSLAYGAGVIGKKIIIEDNVKISRKTIIKTNELHISKNVIFENDCLWLCNKIFIGKYTFISAESRAGWGGEWSNNSEIKIGEFSHIGEQAMLNPSKPVIIGNRVSIGAGTKIYTHQFWQSVLDGYAALHKPVIIEDYVQIGANTVMLPGSVIGSGITIGANSLVSGKFKGPGLLSGNPAKFLQRDSYPRQLEVCDKIKIIKNILKEFAVKYNLKIIEETEKINS
ncbi:MAG TPA: hypothetical protein PKY81_14995, partial [bacterium]|nr:hypothetical protein [bacterium]